MDRWNARAVQFLLDATTDAVVGVDDHGRVAFCNRAGARVIGGSADDLIGRPAADVLVEQGEGSVIARGLGGDEVHGAPTSLRRADGTVVPVLVDVARVDHLVVLVLQDESERVETQAALADAQAHLRDLESLGDVGLWRWAPAADEVQWSEQLFRIHDLDPLAFEGTLTAHLAPIREDHRDVVRRGLREAAMEARPFAAEYVIVRRDGSERWLYSRADPVVGTDGVVVAVTGITQDVTTDRRNRAALEAANARLERFASVLAHDLREPLSLIVGFAEMLVGADLDDETEMFAERIKANGERALDLVADILSEARRRDDVPTEVVDLQAVAAWVRDTLAERIERTGSTVVLEDLAPVQGHEPLLRQALLNLVGNALKYRHPDRGATIRISTMSHDDVVELRVDDNGPGVPREDRVAIFDDGYRLPRDREIDGTGIGLATVREIAERHGAEVAVVDSDLGGARFVLRLQPAAVDDVGAEPRGRTHV